MNNLFAAIASGFDHISGIFTRAHYPTVPATRPNRSVRRGVRFGRALPPVWEAFFIKNPAQKSMAGCL